MSVFTLAFIHNSQRVDTIYCPSRDEWTNKPWYLHTMEYYSAVERSTDAITWMTCDVMLNIISDVSYT